MKNLAFLHSPIVYSTGVSPQIKWYYKRWVTSDKNSRERTRLFLEFMNACENENKNYLHVIDIINNSK